MNITRKVFHGIMAFYNQKDSRKWTNPVSPFDMRTQGGKEFTHVDTNLG